MTRTNFFATILAPLLLKLGLKKPEPTKDVFVPQDLPLYKQGKLYEEPLFVEFERVGPTTVTFPSPSQFDYVRLTFDGGNTWHEFRNGDKFIIDNETGEMIRQ